MRIGVTEILLILLLVLVIFGGGKLAGVGKALGQSIREFKKEATELISGMTDEKIYVAQFDIENFKAFNAKYGFERGDTLLHAVAESLRKVFNDDLISRFSGDHFVVLTKSNDIVNDVTKVKEEFDKAVVEFTNVLRVGIYNLEDKNIDINLACDNAKFACDNLRGRYDMTYLFFDDNLRRQMMRRLERIRLRFISSQLLILQPENLVAWKPWQDGRRKNTVCCHLVIL